LLTTIMRWAMNHLLNELLHTLSTVHQQFRRGG
jgi:hypothetical protein